MQFDEYLDELRRQERSAHIELDPVKEAEYMNEHAHRFKRTLRAVPTLSTPLRILDIGTTPFTIFLKQAFPHYEVTTLDRTELLKDRCGRAGVALRSCNLDLGTIPLEDSYFDVVIFTEVLEHIFSPPSDILREVWRILRFEGKLILSVPNIATLANRVKLLLGGTPLENPDQQMNRDWVHGHGHLHEYTREEIISICRAVGFTVTNTEMLSVNPLHMLGGRVQFSLRRFVYYCAIALLPAFRFTILLECRK